MRLTEPNKALFDALSRITRRVFQADRLLSCDVLSKAPMYGGLMENYLAGKELPEPGLGAIAKRLVRYLAANGAHYCYLIVLAVLVRLVRWENGLQAVGRGSPAKIVDELAKNASTPIVLETYATIPRLVQKGRYQEMYLPGLEAAVRRSGWECVHYFRLYGSRNPKTLWQGIKVLRDNGPGLCEGHLFAATDWLRLLWHILVYPFVLCCLICSLKKYGPQTPEYFIRHALLETLGNCVVTGEANRLAGRRLGLLLARQFTTGQRIIGWYENQTVNKCMLRGLRQAAQKTGKPTATIGAQLLIWPEALLNNHPDWAEARLGLMPDTVLVNGKYFLPEEGVPLGEAERFRVGPALRYTQLFKAGLPRQVKKDSPLLVLLSYHPLETKRVLEAVAALSQSGIPLVFRFHPATRKEDFASLLPAQPRFSTGDLYEALAEARAVMGTGSGALAEAAALGVPVLSVAGGLNYLPALGKGVLWDEVVEPSGIMALLQALEKECAAPGHGACVQELRNFLFCEPTERLIIKSFALKTVKEV